MRIVHIRCSSKDVAERIAPWAFKIIKTGWGYIAFESAFDFETWRKSKS